MKIMVMSLVLLMAQVANGLDGTPASLDSKETASLSLMELADKIDEEYLNYYEINSLDKEAPLSPAIVDKIQGWINMFLYSLKNQKADALIGVSKPKYKTCKSAIEKMDNGSLKELKSRLAQKSAIAQGSNTNLIDYFYAVATNFSVYILPECT